MHFKYFCISLHLCILHEWIKIRVPFSLETRQYIYKILSYKDDPKNNQKVLKIQWKQWKRNNPFKMQHYTRTQYTFRLKKKVSINRIRKNSQSIRRNDVADSAARMRRSNEETSVSSERTRTIVHLWWKGRESGNRKSDGAMWLHD